MSLSDILLHNPDYPPTWSNLSVNSLKARSISVLPIEPESVEIVYLSPTGNDANSGLTTLLPVLTFERAIEVATDFSAETIIFQLQGTGNVSGFLESSDPSLTGYPSTIDFMGLSCKFVNIVGTRINELLVDPLEGTATPSDPFDYWTTVTGLSGLTANLYDQGLVESSSFLPLYASSYDNTTNSISLITNNGQAFVDDGFTIFNLPGLYIEITEKTAILSNVPVIFQDISILGSSDDGDSLVNLTAHPIFLRNCKIYVNNEGCLSGGVWSLEGCYVEGDTYTKQLVSANDLAVVDVDSSQLYQGLHFMQYEGKISNIYTTNYQLLCRGSSMNVVGLISNISGANLDNVIFQGSSGYISNALMYNSDSGYSCIKLDGSNIRTSYLELIINGVVAAHCVNALSSTWRHEGDNICSSTSAPSVILSNSSFELLPSQISITPTNTFESTNTYPITASSSSNIILRGQNTKDTYTIESGTAGGIYLTSGSSLTLADVQSKGPSFSLASGFSMIYARTNSSVRVNGNGYASAGAGDANVILGQSTAISLTPVANIGAIDVALNTTGALDAEACFLTIFGV